MSTPAVDRQRLTPRQRTVLLLAARGLTNDQIAARLSVTMPTVKHDLVVARTVLDARSRAHAVALALAYGLIRREDVLRPEVPR